MENHEKIQFQNKLNKHAVQKSKKKRQSKHRKPSRFRKQNSIIRTLALERIDYLMKTAIQIYSKNPEIAERYVQLARRYSMSSKAEFPLQYKQMICHNCKKLLLPGFTSRHRIQSRKKRGTRYIITCLHCNHLVHMYFKQKKTVKHQN